MYSLKTKNENKKSFQLNLFDSNLANKFEILVTITLLFAHNC